MVQIEKLYDTIRSIITDLVPSNKRKHALARLEAIHVDGDKVLHVPDDLRIIDPAKLDGRRAAAIERRASKIFYAMVNVKNKPAQYLTVKGLEEAARLAGITIKYFQERMSQTNGRFTVTRNGKTVTMSLTQMSAASTFEERREEFAQKYYKTNGVWPNNDNYPSELRHDRHKTRRY